MARSNRDVQLTLRVESLGQEGIKQLQNEVSELAKQGGAAAPEFQQLADEIGRLGQQKQSLDAFRQLADSTDELRVKQEQASQSSAKMASELDALRAATDAARTRQQQATQELNDAQLAQAKATANLRQLKSEYDAAGKNTAGYRSKLEEAVRAQGKANIALVTLKQNQRDANTAVTEAARAQGTLEKHYARSTANADKLASSLKAEEAALRQAAEAAQALGVSTDDVAAAEGHLLAALNSAGREAAVLRDQLTILAAEEEAAATNAKELAAALAAQDAAASAAETAALAKQTQMLAAEQEFAAETARRLAEAQQKTAVEAEALRAAQKDDFAKQLAIAQGLLTTELELQASAAGKLTAAEAEMAAKQRAAADAVTQAAQEMAASAAQAAQRIDTAFGTLGVRSVQEIQKEIADTRAAMATLGADAARTGTQLSGAFAAGEAKIKTLEREIRELTGTLTMADKASSLFKNSLGQIAAGNLIADGVGYLINKVKELGAAFVSTVIQLEQMRRGLNAIYKDTSTTASQIAFLNKTARESGVAVGSLSAEFVRFSASMHSANVPMEQSNALFAALTKAAASLGLDAEATAGSLNALGQMASKGTVSLEELRQQLGDRLPGALGLVAKGMGITQAQLISLVESGQLATRDFIEPFTEALKGLHGETTGILPAWNNLKNMLTSTAQVIGDAGGIELLTLAIRTLGGVLGTVSGAIGVVTTAIGTVIRTGGILAAAVVTWSNPWSALRDLWASAGDRLKGLGLSMMQAIGLGGLFAANAEKTASKTRELGAALDGTTASLRLETLAKNLNADATLNLSAKLIQYQTASQEALKAQIKRVENAAKIAKAAQDEGDALVRITTLMGNEAETSRVSAEAKEKHARALAVETAARNETVAILQQEIAFVEANSKARNLNATETASQTEKLRGKLDTAQAEAEQSKQSAESARAEALQRRLLAETIGDQSQKVAELRRAQENAAQFLKLVIELQAKGMATEEAVRAARERLAVTTYKLRDAESDRTQNGERALQQMRAEAQLTQAQYELDAARLRMAIDQAKAAGDDYRVRQLLIEQKELEIKIAAAARDATIAEAEARKALLNLKAAEIPLDDKLREQKIAAIDLSIKAAEAEILRAKAAGEVVGALERELKAMKDGSAFRKGLVTGIGNEVSARGRVAQATNAHSDALEKLNMQYKLSADYSEAQIALLEKEAAAAERAAEAYRKKWNIDKDGFTLDNNGQRMQQSIPTGRYVYDTAKAQGLTDEEALRLMDRFFQNGRATGWAGQTGINGPSRDWFSIVNEAINEAVIDSARRRAAGGGGGTSANQTPNASTQHTGGSTRDSTTNKTVTINIGGRSQTVKVASDADANALTAILRELENAAGTSS